jgi:hypothetical protein
MRGLSAGFKTVLLVALCALIFAPEAFAFEISGINQDTSSAPWLFLEGANLVFTESGFRTAQVATARVDILYNFEDFDLTFEAKVEEYGLYGSIMVLLHQGDNYAGYSVAIDRNRATVSRRNGFWNDYQWLKNINGALKLGTWHEVRLTCKDQVYTCYLDGTKMGEFEDKDRVYTKGSIDIRIMNSLAEIRNIRVTAEKDPEPKTANIVKIDLTPNRLPNPNALITGTFLQLDYTNTRDQEGSWKDELKAMKDAGLDLLIVPAYSGSTGPVYSVMDELFAEANRQGISIMIGTFSNHSYYWTDLSKKQLSETLEKTKAEITDLYNRYGDNPAFYGWYITDEIDEKDLIPSKFDLTTWYYSEQVNHIKSLTPEKPIMLSPSYESNTSPKWWEEKYDKFLEVVKIDILGPQDSVGAKRSTPEMVSTFFQAFKNACDKHGVRLWADVEIFDIDVWLPADIDLVKRQLFAVEPFVEKVVIFEFNHYMNPYKNNNTKKLYENYLQWLSSF